MFFFMRKFKKIIVFFLFLVLFFSPVFVLADNNNDNDNDKTIKLENPLKIGSIKELVEALVDFITKLAIAISPIIFIWAGFLFYFAGGDPEKVKTATNLIKWAVIGLAIIIVANGIVYVIGDIIGVEEME